ncbi:MAG: EAL domain-containing protein [Actinobacteria bacterium]|nr:EAL domain-containing protein [Actinomycetota bacterium]
MPKLSDASPVERFRFTPEELTTLFTFVDETLVAFDEAGLVTFASPSVRELIGIDPEHVVGTPVLDYIHPDDVDDALARIARWQGRQGATRGPDTRVRHVSGRWVTVSLEVLTGAPVRPLGSIVLTLRPLTERFEVESELRQRLVNEDRLTRLARSFLGLSMDRFDDGVQRALAEMGSMDGVDRVSVWRVLDDGGGQTKTHEWTAPDIESTLGSSPILPMGGGPFLDQLVGLHEVNVPSVDELPDEWSAERGFWRRRGVVSVLAVPMMERGRYVGFLALDGFRETRIFEAKHVSTLRTAAGILAQAFARQAAEQRLAYQARFDSLTGLGNRWFFRDELASSLEHLEARREGGLAALLLDLDRFKVVNDSLGHTAGDELLAAVAERLASSLDPDHVIARLGGDELVVLADRVDLEAALTIARHKLEVLEDPFRVGQHEVYVTASVGVAYTTGGQHDAEELLRQADAAMYAAKERGRNRIEVFDDDLRDRVNRRLKDENDLRRALGNGELTVHYQPEIDIETGSVVAAEALVRWQHPDNGLRTASEFIGVAEETAAILDIGPFVLREACQQLGRWCAARPGLSITMRVNLSARQLTQPDLVPLVVEVIDETGIDPASLCLEITETTLMADPEVSLDVLRSLRGLGVQLAVDDFGTGYSSLSYLKQFPVTVLKIDRSFVDGLGRDPDDTAIVAAIVSLAKALRIGVTAEGVETQQQLDELRRLGCRRVQGYLLARPAPAADVFARL